MDLSLYREARRAALDFQQALAARCGAAVGAEAITEWNRERFWLFAAARIIEHLAGDRLYVELDPARFALGRTEPARLAQACQRLAAIDAELGGVLAREMSSALNAGRANAALTTTTTAHVSAAATVPLRLSFAEREARLTELAAIVNELLA